MKNLRFFCPSLILFFKVTILLCSETLANPACPFLDQRIKLFVKTVPINTSYHFSADQVKLDNLSMKYSNRPKNQKVLGLTSTKHAIVSDMAGKTFQIAQNLFCTRIVSLNIDIKIIKLDVYVLRKYQRGSCQYSAIIDHEHEHVASYLTGIANLKQAFDENLWNIIKNLPPGIGTTPELSSQASFRNLRRSISKLQAPIERSMKTRDRAIDSPSSYRNLTYKCAGW